MPTLFELENGTLINLANVTKVENKKGKFTVHFNVPMMGFTTYMANMEISEADYQRLRRA